MPTVAVRDIFVEYDPYGTVAEIEDAIVDALCDEAYIDYADALATAEKLAPKLARPLDYDPVIYGLTAATAKEAP
jgi:hypothetical protein